MTLFKKLCYCNLTDADQNQTLTRQSFNFYMVFSKRYKMLEPLDSVLRLPYLEDILYLTHPDEKPGYDAFDSIVGEAILETLNKHAICKIDGKKYAQLGVKNIAGLTGVSDNEDTELEDQDEQFEEEENVPGALLTTCFGLPGETDIDPNQNNHQQYHKKEEQKQQLMIDDSDSTSNIIKEYFPKGSSYLDVIQNKEHTLRNDDQNIVNVNRDDFFLQKLFNNGNTTVDGVTRATRATIQGLVDREKKTIENLSNSLMLASALMMKPLEAPCFGITRISESFQQRKQSEKSSFEVKLNQKLKKGKIDRSKKQQSKPRQPTKKKAMSRVYKTEEERRMDLIKGDLIEDDEDDGYERTEDERKEIERKEDEGKVDLNKEKEQQEMENHVEKLTEESSTSNVVKPTQPIKEDVVGASSQLNDLFDDLLGKVLHVLLNKILFHLINLLKIYFYKKKIKNKEKF